MMEAQEKQYEFYVDAKRYVTEERNLNGAQIKAQGGVPETYQLFEEVEGDEPDIAISDAQTASLEGRVKHFFAVPPATFGRA